MIRLGGDTDTNAAILGALLGARFGFDAMMKEPTTTKANIEIALNCRPFTWKKTRENPSKEESRPLQYTLPYLLDLLRNKVQYLKNGSSIDGICGKTATETATEHHGAAK